MNKRDFLRKGLLLGTGAMVAPSILKSHVFAAKTDNTDQASSGGFIQLPLPYAFNALEPHIDTQTMEVHYQKHHAAYSKKFNEAIKEENLIGHTMEEIFGKISNYPASIRNNGGGYYNHNFFWQVMSPTGGGEPTGELLQALENNFGGYSNFKESFSKSASSVFGSGWTWLIKQEGTLKIISTPNQDNPLMDVAKEKGIPLLCLDIWEHAYYLKYQNRRAEYITAFWNVVNWNFVSENFLKG